jgi:serine/threonine protein kinase
MGAGPSKSGKLRSLFLQALDLSPAERSELLNDISPVTRQELQDLLQADLGAETFFKNTIASEQPPASGVGEHFGPFEAVELLGRGGMGAVFKAERIDGELTQTVAIKVVERGWLAPRALERFRQERQFLAGLTHANIARLIDGGTRHDGIPYLVMEYVDGLPLDQFAERRQLSIEERIRLFLPLCDAVDYAHQKLIIHRDLKPSNVLVTALGQPKLLDFGIAKALDATAGEAQTMVLTPEFASPEQALGGEITTATDVYGLGAVLYLLLTGRAPHTVDGLSPAEVQRAVCDSPPARPGLLTPELAGDLENILLKALHPEAHRRYRSAGELAEDLERYLSHQPVRATPDSFAYRTGRFLRRHALASAATSLGLIAVLSGAVISVYEARRAEQRFAQVRELANHFVFDFESSIRDIPGTLAARRMAVSTGRQYLAQLSEDARGDANLTADLAQSYDRLSNAEMSAGESGPAIEHAKKTIDLLRRLKADCCGPAERRALYVRAWADLAIFQSESGSTADALASSVEATRAARAWWEGSPKDPAAMRALVIGSATQGGMLANLGRGEQALPYLEQADQLSEDLFKQSAADEDLLFIRVRVDFYLARVLNSINQPGKALESNQHALAILNQLLQKHPESGRWRRLKGTTLSGIARSFRQLSENDPSLRSKAIDAAREAYLYTRGEAATNPGDNSIQDATAVDAMALANALSRDGKPLEELPLIEEARVIIDRLVQKDPSNRRFLGLQESDRTHLAAVFTDLSRWQDALATLQQADHMAQVILKRWPDDPSTLDDRISLAALATKTELALGHPQEARNRCAAGLQLAADFMLRQKDSKYTFTLLGELRKQARALGVTDVTLKTP